MKIIVFLLLALTGNTVLAENTPSVCYGTPQDGHLVNGWQLPSSGKNFSAYSSLGTLLGRNYVHSKVYSVVLAAYKELEVTAPEKIFVYGETGFKDGGQIKPHKTHRNGLSVDFFVPILNPRGISVKLPTGALNKLGYNIEFNSVAKFEGYKIDFEAMAKHLLAIQKAAKAQGVGIRVVIFENAFQKMLFATSTGAKLPGLIKFSVAQPWVRHDEHYHIDFEVACK